MQALKAALFDMDGLLLDTERLSMGIFCDLVAVHGMDRPVAEALYRRVVGTSFRNTRNEVAKALPQMDLEQMDHEWSARLESAFEVHAPMRPTVPETIARLSKAGIPMVVVTTTRVTPARKHLSQAGLLHFFEDVIGFERVTRPKPDPDPYLTGAARLNISPEQCAAFEDSDTGTTAACAAGCNVWQVPDIRPEGKPLPELGQRQAVTLEEAILQAFPTLTG